MRPDIVRDSKRLGQWTRPCLRGRPCAPYYLYLKMRQYFRAIKSSILFFPAHPVYTTLFMCLYNDLYNIFYYCVCTCKTEKYISCRSIRSSVCGNALSVPACVTTAPGWATIRDFWRQNLRHTYIHVPPPPTRYLANDLSSYWSLNASNKNKIKIHLTRVIYTLRVPYNNVICLEHRAPPLSDSDW